MSMHQHRQTFSPRLRVAKWVGFVLGTVATILHQQVVVTVAYTACPERVSTLVISMGALSGVLALAGVLVSWWARQSLPQGEEASLSLRTDRFIATLAAVFAFMALLFVLFSTPIGMILQCERV